jgi:hypothetical protein
MAQALPKEIDYSPIASLPESTQSATIVASPVNGQTFGPNSLVQFDMVTRGYLVPESLYIRYKLTTTLPATAGANNGIRGTPVYSPFSRLEVSAGSQIIESISQYNMLSNMLVNTRMNYASKVGLAAPLGYAASVGGVLTYPFDFGTNAPNGMSLATSVSGGTLAINGGIVSLAAPLGCILSNADRLVPLKYLPSMRIQLTCDSLANIYRLDGTYPVTNFSISNFELVYDVIDFNPRVDEAITQRSGGVITIKSQSYLVSGSTIPSGSNGVIQTVFNVRLASIKSLFAHLSSNTSANTFFDSVDVTSNSGDYSFNVSGSIYPPRPISMVLNRNSYLMELSNAFGPVNDILTSQFAINPVEAGFTIASLPTTLQSMGKVYIGTNTERLSTSALLTGISSQGSPISLQISTSTATAAASTAYLVCLYDALLQIDLNARTLTVMQ